ncbi:MAG: PAS domain S-box protein [Planctomycetota bacterium]|jgi:PAS domain S-box-containing protein
MADDSRPDPPRDSTWDAKALREAAQLLEIQRDLAIALSTVHRLGEALRLCLSSALRASRMDCGGIYLLDDETRGFELSCHSGLSEDFVRRVSSLPPSDPSTGILMRGQPVYSRHPELGVKLDEIKRQEQLRAIAVVPVLHRERVIGCMNVASHALEEVPVASRTALEAIAAQIGSAIDHVRAEESLRTERGRAQHYLDIIATMLVALDAGGRVTMINRKGLDILGYGEPEVVGRDWFANFLPERMRVEMRKVFGQIMAGSFRPVEYYENPVLTAGGEERLIAWRNSLLRDECGRIVGTLSSGEDITESRQADEALARSEAELREAHQMARMGRWDFRHADNNLRWTDTIYEIFEIERSKFGETYEAFLDAVHPDDREMVDRAWKKSLEDGSPYEIEHRLLMSDGRAKWVLERCRTQFDESGAPVLSSGIVQDITGRKRAEEELRKSEIRYRSFVENTSDAVFCYEYDPPIQVDLPLEEQVRRLYGGVLAECNEACARSYGAGDREEVIGRKLTELFGTSSGSLEHDRRRGHRSPPRRHRALLHEQRNRRGRGRQAGQGLGYLQGHYRPQARRGGAARERGALPRLRAELPRNRLPGNQ